MRRLAVLAVTALLVGCVAAPAQAMGKVKAGKARGCPVILGTAPNDSTRLNGEPDATTHVHEFAFNDAVLRLGNTVTYDDAVATGPNPCTTEPNDTAGVWEPILCTDATCAERVQVAHHTLYYRCASGKNTGCPDTQAMPKDARLISDHYNWTCGQNSGPVYSQPVDHIPDCPDVATHPGDTLTMHVTFPSYWDGQLNDHTAVGDVNDNAHFAFPLKGGGAPPGFPIPVTQIKYAVQYAHNGPAGDLILSADVMDGTTGGRSEHADYSQWTQPDPTTATGTWLDTFIARCVQPATQAKNCG